MINTDKKSETINLGYKKDKDEAVNKDKKNDSPFAKKENWKQKSDM